MGITSHFSKQLIVSLAISGRGGAERVEELTAHFFMSLIQECVGRVSPAFELRVTRVLSCHFQSEPGSSQSRRGLQSDASPVLTRAASSLLCQE